MILEVNLKSYESNIGSQLDMDISFTDPTGNRYGFWVNDPALLALPGTISDVVGQLVKVHLAVDSNREQILNTLSIAKLEIDRKQGITTAPPSHRTIKASKQVEFINNGQNEYSVALIIGNKSYFSSGNSVPDVDYAINDAAAIKEYLIDAKGYKEGNIIYLENASQAQIISALGNEKSFKGKLYNWVRPQESDVFVYYSGHGAPSLTDGSGYLLPTNADPSTVELNGYSINTLYANLAKLPAKSVTVVIDACFSGSSQAGSITQKASSISLKPIVMPKKASNMNVLTATNIGEVASWDTESKHGLFTSYFLKAINGDADKGKSGNTDKKVSLSEIKKYLDLKVTYMARRQYGREQNPQVSGDGDFVFSALAQ
jgi:hypothetical protein